MEIIWYGQSCFLIKTKQLSIVIDPYSQQVGLKLPSLKANIVAVTHDHFDHNNISAVLGINETPPFIIKGPGEYGLKEIEVTGIPTFHDSQKGALRRKNTIYVFKIEDLTIAHLGDLGHTLKDEDIEALNQIDVLMVPIGGNYTIDAQKAVEVINQIDPKIVIPMHYKIPGLSEQINLDSIDNFSKQIGETEGSLDSLRVTPKDLPNEEERRIIILKPRVI